ncbi:alcohol dehydrogenase [Colletotrichum sp. SAR11_240]|nr:alcohol dehydrogenase [Colletotrichum sp. SAR11_240]
MSFPQTFTLNNGRKVPAVGFGTFQGTEGNSKVKDAVKLALSLGYRHIDGANAYGNEKDIGEAIEESGIPREEIFVTSKLHPSGNGKPVIDYDLSRRYPETWQAMEKLVDSGKARSIGLSNFNVLKTKRILEVAKIVPAVNQVELHPSVSLGLSREELL